MVGVTAIALNARGGGVAAASRRIWYAVRDRWGDAATLRTLVPDDSASIDSGLARRLRCGAEVALAERGGCEWMLFTHLSVARIQRYVPGRWARPYGIVLHGIEIWRPLDSAQRRIVEGASLLIANSAYTAARIREANPWMGPVEVCPLALDPALEDVLAAPPACAAQPTVLVVGRMCAAERYKGHDELIDVWTDVASAVPGARLVFAGTGDDEARLRRRAVDLGLSDRVRVTGFVSTGELLRHYAEAAVFALPSRNEGFGLVYLEAMAHGLPCIGSTLDAAREVIADGATGLLVDPGDRRRLVEALVGLLRDPERRHRMGEEGRRRVARHFSYGAFRERLLPIIDRRLAPARRPASAVQPLTREQDA
jgi:phosphatidylinositol alpha-1,6-mannosyltransferase